MDRTLAGIYLQVARSRLVVHQTEQLRACLQALDDQQIWWRPNEGANSIGNLVLHLCGSTRYYIGHVLGRSGYVRDRDAEFAERTMIPKTELLQRINETVTEADRVLSSFDPDRLLDTVESMGKPTSGAQVILHALIHYAAHVGQIVYATKMLRAGALDDIWRRTPLS
jgi:uncharacterized damage-inducible protein DinB